MPMKISFISFISSAISTQLLNSNHLENINQSEQEDLRIACNSEIFSKVFDLFLENSEESAILLGTNMMVVNFDKNFRIYTSNLDLQKYRYNIIELLNNSNLELNKFFIKELKLIQYRSVDLATYSSFVLKALGLYFDLSNLGLNLAKKNVKDILKKNRSSYIKVAIKILIDDLMANSIEIIGNETLFSVVNDYFYIDIIKIFVSFDMSDNNLFPVKILEILKNFFDNENYLCDTIGKINFKSRILVDYPNFVSCLVIEVEYLIEPDGNNFYIAEDVDRISIYLIFMRETLKCYFESINWEPIFYSEKTS